MGKEFKVEGVQYTLEQMLESNGDDPDFCEWAKSAQPGESFPGGAGGELVQVVPARHTYPHPVELEPGDLTVADLAAIDAKFSASAALRAAQFAREDWEAVRRQMAQRPEAA